MLNIVFTAVTAVLTAAGALVFAPILFGRNLSTWEDLLCGGFALVITGFILGYRKRQEHKRLIGMRDSALW